MVNLLNKIIENNVIFGCVIGALCIVLVILVILIVRSVRENHRINIYEEELEDEDIKKVKNVKKEDIIEEPDVDAIDFDYEDEEVIEKPKKIEKKEENYKKIDDEEIEERYSKEKEKEINEVKEINHNEQLQKILEKMEKDSKLSPEDVVANFEKEQEAQSIISYKELVNAVKNRQDDDYEDELEAKPLTTVTEYLKQKDNQEPIDFSDFTTVINTIYDKKEEPVRETKYESSNDRNYDSVSIEEKYSYEDEKSRFKKTEVISPIYGRMEEPKKEVDYGQTIDLRDLDLTDNDFTKESKKEVQDEVALSALDDVYKKMADNIIKKNEDNGETTSLDALARNEDFLQSLKDFRKKL